MLLPPPAPPGPTTGSPSTSVAHLNSFLRELQAYENNFHVSLARIRGPGESWWHPEAGNAPSMGGLAKTPTAGVKEGRRSRTRERDATFHGSHLQFTEARRVTSTLRRLQESSDFQLDLQLIFDIKFFT